MTEAIKKNKKRLLKNVRHLFFAQGINYIFPLLTLPYLTYTLGIDGFGVYAFAQVIIQYFQVFIDYGFNLTATRKLAAAQDNNEKINRIFWSVLLVKIILGIIVTTVGWMMLLFYAPDKKILWLYIYSFLAVWGSIFFPVWYFQGLESMRQIAWINLASKLLSIIMLLALVHDAGDIAMAGLSQAMSSIFAGILACLAIYKSGTISKIKTTKIEIIDHFMEGRHIFLTSLFSSILANSGVFFLGIYHSSEVVGIYASSEKIAKAAVGLFSPITLAIYPNSAKAFSRSIHDGYMVVRSTGFYVILLGLIAALFLWFLSPYIAMLLKWEDVRHIYVIKLLAPWLFFGVVNNIFGIQILTAMGEGKAYSRIFMFVSFVLLMILLTFVEKYDITAILIGMNIAECLLTLLLILVVYNKWKAK